jgi:hypothetical protein
MCISKEKDKTSKYKDTFATNELSLENTIYKARKKRRIASEDIESKQIQENLHSSECRGGTS